MAGWRRCECALQVNVNQGFASGLRPGDGRTLNRPNTEMARQAWTPTKKEYRAKAFRLVGIFVFSHVACTIKYYAITDGCESNTSCHIFVLCNISNKDVLFHGL